MRRYIIGSCLVILFLALWVPPAALAEMRGDPPPPMKWWRVPEFAQKLGLTRDEIGRLDKMFIESHTKLIDAEAARDKARLILEDLVERDELDEKAVYEQLEVVNLALATINTERFRFLVEIRKFLGAERFAQLKGIFDQHRMRRRMKDRPGLKPEGTPEG